MGTKARFPIVRLAWPRVTKFPRHFMVDGRLSGGRRGRREYFTDKKLALARADQLFTERHNEGVRALDFTVQDRALYAEAREILRPFDRSIRDAAHHYAAWLKTEAIKNTSPLVRDCLTQYFESRERECARGDLSKRSLIETRHFVRRLTAAVGELRLAELGAPTIATFLDSLPVTARTRLNNRARISKFMSWCKRKQLIIVNPIAEVEVPKVRRGEVAVLTVEEAERLMLAASHSPFAQVMVPFFACCLFGSLRSGEAAQLDWKDIDFRRRAIYVHSETSKRRESRWVHMETALVAFLKPHRKDSGRICGANFRRQFESVVKELGRQWQTNVCRHTGISNLLALKNDRAYVAEQAGTSVIVIRVSYRRPILKRDAVKFWALRPSTSRAARPVSPSS